MRRPSYVCRNGRVVFVLSPIVRHRDRRTRRCFVAGGVGGGIGDGVNTTRFAFAFSFKFEGPVIGAEIGVAYVVVFQRFVCRDGFELDLRLGVVIVADDDLGADAIEFVVGRPDGGGA